MSFKLKRTILSFILILSIFAYKVDPIQANQIKKDVPKANGRVRFKYNLSTVIPYISADKPYDLGFKGQGTYIVILDTGIQSDHPFFQDRVAIEACFAAKCPNGTNTMIGIGAAKPVHWHGTHVAGIAAGYSSATMHGIAPEAKIIAVNVFDATGAAYDSDIVRALRWIESISDQYNIAAINMSLGTSNTFTGTCDNYIPSMTLAIKDLKDKNIPTVIAAGNSYSYGMSSPACISYSVSVAATYKTNDTVTDYSNINEYTTIAAPGSAINSSKTGSSYGTASGTSMATPVVVGAFAVYRSKYGIQSVDTVVSQFKSSGKPARDNFTQLVVQRLDLRSLFTDSSGTTTTTTTVVSTTTTLPPTTTTLPPTTTTTTLPPKTPYIPNPLLLEINGSGKTYVWIKYRDPYMNKSLIKNYVLVCNGNKSYTIPKEDMYSLHNYYLSVSASEINYCYLYGLTIYGTKTNNTSTINIYPKNK